MEDSKTVVVDVSDKKSSGPVRGVKGEPTASLTLKQKWHEAHFTLEDTSNGKHPHRKTWRKNPKAPSLKAFAKQLDKDGDTLPNDWWSNKQGLKNAKRTPANIEKARASKTASSLARKKSKNASKKPEVSSK